MNKDDRVYEQSLQEIEAFAGELYADALARHGQEEKPEDESEPLFQALRDIQHRYETPERIGSGGMKEVFRVYDRRSTRHVAMAKPLPTLRENDYDGFLREAHITARLDHPGIVKLFDMGIDDDGRPYFTMELKRGRSLRELLREAKEGGDFPRSRRLSVMHRICEAVAYAHSRHVLHLDLKPENIQVGGFGEVQVCDWGMSVVIRPESGELEETDILLDPDLYGPLLMHSRGTPGYMAPEQSEAGRPKSVQMDVYSLGCLLQELLTLQVPEQSPGMRQTDDQALGSIVDKAREKNPMDRYATVAELQEDLSRYLSGYSTSVENAGFLREAQLFYRRHRSTCVVVAGLLILAAVGTAAFIEQLRRSRGEAVAARQVAEQARELYRTQKVEAQTALQNYLAATEESERRLEEQARLAAQSVAKLTREPFPLDEEILPRIVSEGLWRMNRVVALDPPPDSPLWHQKFWILFLSQNLQGALKISGGDLDPVQDLVGLAHKYAQHQTESGALTAPAFGQLMRDLVDLQEPPREPLMERMLVYDMKFPRTNEERVSILREVIAALNPDARNVQLSFEPSQRSLEVTGSGIRRLSLRPRIGCSGLSLLRFLKPLRVVLQGTSVEDLEELNGLQPLMIDLRETEVTDLYPLIRMDSLQEVKLTPGRFTKEQLAILQEQK